MISRPGALSTGHARALFALSDAAAQRQAAREVISRAAVGPRNRGARQAAVSPKEPRRPRVGTMHRSPARTCIPELQKTGSVSPSERRSGSCGEARAAESRSISVRKPS